MIFSFIISFLFVEKIYGSDSRKWLSIGVSAVLMVIGCRYYRLSGEFDDSED